MKVLVVGRGGREHAIAWKMSQSPQVEAIFVAPGNIGMQDVAICIPIEENQFDELIHFAKKQEIDLTIVGPEVPLMAGIANRFQEAGLRIFGPRKEAAIIEGSKAFTKDLLKKYQIPTAAYESFTDYEAAKTHLQKVGAPVVIKADGLAAGKGVVVAPSLDKAERALEEMMANQQFGAASTSVIIEEYLEGPEFSLMAFVNGSSVYPMPIAQDHKRAFDNDQGPNTGGMGAYSPVPQISHEVIVQAIETILQPVADAMVAEGRSFTGILYAGLMLTAEGTKVIEFNARFGDPEAGVILPRLETELAEVLLKVLEQQPVTLSWSEEAVVGIVLATKGYPGTIELGHPIAGIEKLALETLVFHSGTAIQDGQLVTNGGRVLLIACKASTLKTAKETAYQQIQQIQSEGTFYRTDIGAKVEE